MLDYNKKSSDYYKKVRREIIDEVPLGSDTVLDIGCGEGLSGLVLKEESRAKWIAGVELMEDSANQAAKRLDKVIIGSIENINLPFQDNFFDVIIMADVLEHLIDPWTTLNKLKALLKPDGMVLISLPNVRCWRVLFPLLFRGKWEYQSEGILDRTHLRFFTKLSMIELLTNCGFKIKKIVPVSPRSRQFLKLHMKTISDIYAFQYVLIGINSDKKNNLN